MNNKITIRLTFLLLSFTALAGCRKRDSQYYATELWEAVRKGDTSKVNSILTKKPELINIRDEEGHTLLHLSPWELYEDSTHKDVMKLLISKGADVNATDRLGYTPLHDAARDGLKEIIRILLANGADIHAKEHVGMTPLHCAALNARHNGAIQLLLDKGADINAKNMSGQTPIESAWPIPRLSWPEGYDPNDKYAIWSAENIQPRDYDDHIETIKVFLDNGVDANTWRSSPKGELNRDEDPNKLEPEPVYPMLISAATNNQKELVEIVLAYGADVNSKGAAGLSALHIAALKGNIQIAQMLIEKGADVNSEATQGATPLFFAEHRKHTELADLLRKHGAEK